MKVETSGLSFPFEMGFFASSSIIFAGSFVVNLLNYIFTLLMSRLLSVEDFGEVAALLSLFIIISVPATALAMLMARESAHYKEQGDSGVRYLFIRMRAYSAAGAVGLWALFIFLVPFVSDYLRIPTLPIYIFSAVAPLAILGALQSGTLQGLQKFFSVAKQGILSALVKLGGSVLLVWAGFSVAGVMGALVLASLASFIYGFFATRSHLRGVAPESGQAFNISGLATYFGGILLTTLLLALLSNVDVILAKHYLSADLAGQYGALSTVGKILIYGVGAFISVLLPLAAAAHARGEGAERDVLWLSLMSVAVVSFGAFIVFSLFPHLVVSLLFGARYVDIAAYLGTFTIAMACIALSSVFINYFVATRNTSFVYLLGVGIAAEIGLIALYHDSLVSIVHSLVYASVALLALMVGNYFVAYRGRVLKDDYAA
ncbi:hypothetical protein A2704_03475 [Candidatus Kaiserbacteria bacterium RIFCSPHIGHO2_01_FULL_54_36b]|uniref:Polysaccharide biosynthesis protein C-terminal domain-containing protein n=1 Tax=Candidatus Kaiserbacteria bacterium RIFCSPHIGHO2_01_FULL_54_36b TaxID=1798483 RepID=A0A1F6CR92_9BACT|nr:MAG: hypothetical protein A2704_03475 [Candidatus Kaiserbacteria bacterium RIFCSPHIGHO2_01_FULL_54_36b]